MLRGECSAAAADDPGAAAGPAGHHADDHTRQAPRGLLVEARCSVRVLCAAAEITVSGIKFKYLEAMAITKVRPWVRLFGCCIYWLAFTGCTAKYY